MAVLFFSRALHLDPKLVRGESEWSLEATGWHKSPLLPLSNLLSPSSQDHQILEPPGGEDVGEEITAGVSLPSGRLLCIPR